MAAVISAAFLISCSHSEAKDIALPEAASEVSVPAAWTASRGLGELPVITAARTQLHADLQVIENVASELASACMAAKGFRFEPTAIEVDRHVDPFAAPRLDPERTRLEGYGSLLDASRPAGQTAVGPVGPSVDEFVESLPKPLQAQFEAAFFGTQTEAVELEGGAMTIPKDGCLADARRAVGGDAFREWTAVEDAFANAIVLAINELESSNAYQQAQAHWSSCMEAAGYRFRADSEAMSEALERFGPAAGTGDRSVSDDEKRMATADAECRIDADLLGTVVRVQRQEERRALVTVEAPMLSWLEERDAVLRKAEAAKQGPGGG